MQHLRSLVTAARQRRVTGVPGQQAPCIVLLAPTAVWAQRASYLARDLLANFPSSSMLLLCHHQEDLTPRAHQLTQQRARRLHAGIVKAG